MIPLGKTHIVEFAFGGWGRNEPMGAPWNPWDARRRIASPAARRSGSAVAVAGGPRARGDRLRHRRIDPHPGRAVRADRPETDLRRDQPGRRRFRWRRRSIRWGRSGAHGRRCRAARPRPWPDPDPRATRPRSARPRSISTRALAAEPDVRGMRIIAPPVEQFASPDTRRTCARACYAGDRRCCARWGAASRKSRAPFDFEDLMLRNGRDHRRRGAGRCTAATSRTPSLRRSIPGCASARSAARRSARPTTSTSSPRRSKTAAAFAEWMRGRDAVLLTPTLPITATPVDEVDAVATPLATFTRVANYLGICALSLPAGMSADGLPVAVQLLARHAAEATLIRAGCAFQQATEWHLQARRDLSGVESAAAARAPLIWRRRVDTYAAAAGLQDGASPSACARRKNPRLRPASPARRGHGHGAT